MNELVLHFDRQDAIEVRFGEVDSGAFEFVSPVTAKDRADIQWYLEVYGAHSLGDPDDLEASRIRRRLVEIGDALFDAAFASRAAQRLFNEFQDDEQSDRLLTISTRHPSVLSLPWELLHDPASGGVFLFREHPTVSIRRRFRGGTGGRRAFGVTAKDRVHLLFVVCRPQGSGFLDPRADPGAVLDAVQRHAPGQRDLGVPASADDRCVERPVG